MPTPGPQSPNFTSLVEPFIDIKRDFAAQGDNQSIDNAPLNNALSAASQRFGAGKIYLPPGTYILNAPVTMLSQVDIEGAGPEKTIIKLANNANCDMFVANTGFIGLGAAFGSGNVGGIFNFSFRNLTLDGNKANQSGTSYGLRIYGYGFILENVRIRNFLTDGMLIDWNGGSSSPGQDQVGAQFVNCKWHDNGGCGFRVGGPQKSQFINCETFANGLHGIHLAPNARDCAFTNLLSYGAAQGVTGGAIPILCEANNVRFVNVRAQDSDTVQVVLLGNEDLYIGDVIGGTGNASTAGIQIGQASGNTPYNGQIDQSAGTTTAQTPIGSFVEGIIDSCLGTNGSVWLANDGGQSKVNVTCKQASGSAVTGTPVLSSFINTGATPNGGSVSATAVAIANGNTINTSNAVSRVNPGANVTGIIMQSGVVPGQMCFVDNISANTVTFATVGTSHVSDGATAAIPANAGRLLVWDGTNWIRAA
ncbi:MAG TPA: glycosyl hydrolase family 28-related protein [Ktedonobacteraceae bacterium]|nr:glycosyl hydrolase family 28-related protein [Ktedonobacteraceae bacterium]